MVGAIRDEELEVRKRKKEDEEEEVKEEEEDEFEDDVEEEEEDEFEDDVEEEEEEDSCVYDQYEIFKELPEDYFSDDEPTESINYCRELRKSEGFNVPSPPEGAIAAILPISPAYNVYWPAAKKGTQLAVEHYNRRRAGPDGKLQDWKLVTANIQPVAGWLFYVTVEAVNATSGYKDTYETKLYRRFDGVWNVLTFRLKR